MARTPPAWHGREAFLPLESRTLLSTVSWDGGGDGVHWSDPANWSGDALPGPNDAVLINVAADPTIVFDLPAAKVKSITSREHIRLESGTLTVWQEWRQAALLEIAGGSIGGAGNLVLSRPAVWSAGDLVGPGKVQIVSQGSLEIAAPDGVSVATSRLIVDNGYLRWTSGDILLVNQGGIRVISGQTFDAWSHFGVVRGSGTTARIELGGVLNTAGPSVTFDVPVFTTSISAAVNAGAVFQQFRGVGALSGTINGALSNTNRLNLTPGSSTVVLGDFKLIQQGTITGTGSLYLVTGSGSNRRVISGTVDHHGLFQIVGASVAVYKSASFSTLDLRHATLTMVPGVALTAGTINSDQGVIDYTDTLTVGSLSGTLGRISGALHLLGPGTINSWALGYVTVEGDVIFTGLNNSATNLGGPGSVLIAEGAHLSLGGTLGKNLINHGTLVLYSSLTLGNVTITNEGSILATYSVSFWPYYSSGGQFYGRGAIVNHGTMTFDTLSNGIIDGPTFDNQGTVTVRSRLQVAAANVAQIQGSTLAAGTWDLEGGSILFTGGDLRINRTTVLLHAANVNTAFPAIRQLERNEGTLDVSGSVTFLPEQGLFTNAGTIRIGSNSSVAINGWFTQVPGAELAVAANNPTARGHLDATGQLSLAGRLRVSFDSSQGAPAISSPGIWAVLLSGSQRAGQFDETLIPQPLPPLTALTLDYDAASVRLNYL
jgi:hypothetical protein